MTPAPRVPTARRRPAALTALTALAVAVGALLGGCADLRLETPPPATPSPDAREQLRDRTARDAAELARLATRAALTAPEGVATALGRVADVSVAHADAFGGVYVPFPDEAPQPSPTATAAPAEVSVAEVRAALAQATQAARADAETVADGDLARLLAAVWVSRTLLAEALDDAVAAAEDGDGDGGSAGGPGEATAGPDVAAVAEVPAGLDADAVATLVTSEDAAGFAWEVVAARSSGDDRSRAHERARLHRDLAEAWAQAAGVARTADDPRRAAYALPEALTAADAGAEAMGDVTAEIEAALVVTYTTLVAGTDAGARGPVLDALLAQVGRGLPTGPVPAFPGMPERA